MASLRGLRLLRSCTATRTEAVPEAGTSSTAGTSVVGPVALEQDECCRHSFRAVKMSLEESGFK